MAETAYFEQPIELRYATNPFGLSPRVLLLVGLCPLLGGASGLVFLRPWAILPYLLIPLLSSVYVAPGADRISFLTLRLDSRGWKLDGRKSSVGQGNWADLVGWREFCDAGQDYIELVSKESSIKIRKRHGWFKLGPKETLDRVLQTLPRLEG